METLREWLEAHKTEITHFRPRRWCGVEQLYAYNRNKNIPLIESAPQILDTQENSALIAEVLGPGYVEEPFSPMPGSRNY